MIPTTAAADEVSEASTAGGGGPKQFANCGSFGM